MLHKIKKINSAIVILMITILTLLFSSCSGNKLSNAQKLLNQTGNGWELTEYINEYSGKYSNGNSYTIIRARGKFYDGQSFLVLLNYSKSDQVPKLYGYYLKATGSLYANGVIVFPNGSITTYTDYSELTY